MFSTNLKRSVATLGVVAGLLAAAGPASAQVMPGTMGVKAPTKVNAPFTLDVATSEVFELNTFGGDDTLKVETEVTDYLADAGTGDDKLLIGKDSTHFHDGSSNTVMFAETGRSDAKTPSLIAKGTQVGSEGVKAPTRADDQVKVSVYNPKEIGID